MSTCDCRPKLARGIGRSVDSSSRAVEDEPHSTSVRLSAVDERGCCVTAMLSVSFRRRRDPKRRILTACDLPIRAKLLIGVLRDRKECRSGPDLRSIESFEEDLRFAGGSAQSHAECLCAFLHEQVERERARSCGGSVRESKADAVKSETTIVRTIPLL